jgi:transposase
MCSSPAFRAGEIVGASGCGCRFEDFIRQSLEESVASWRCANAAGQASSGQAAKLALQQKRRLVAPLRQGSRHWGYAPDGWSALLVQDLIRRLFAVEYHPDYVGTLLHRLGWSLQKPEQCARERREKEIAHWRLVRWPQLK